jgi:hypothetical protein
MLGFMADASDGSNEVVERLRREKEALSEINARLAAEKLGLEQEIGKLKKELEKAREQIEELQRTAARQAAPFRRREALKVAEKKRPGRPAGHRGVRRPRPPHCGQTGSGTSTS